MKTLILAEKPSVAKDFARALNCSYTNGYHEGHKYIVTNALGHLLALYEPSDYNPELKVWKVEDLPILPEKFKFKPIENNIKQLNMVKSLVNRDDVGSYILATDAGREGEVIGRLVLSHSGVKDFTKVKRFWSSEALTPDVIARGMEALHDSSEYDDIYHTGFYRTLADWTTGLNFTRFFSLQLGQTFSFGRVQTAVLGLICERKNAIDNFVSSPYYQLRGDFQKKDFPFTAMYYDKEGQKSFSSRDLFLPMIEKVLATSTTAQVTDVETQRKETKPPALYDLTTLQRVANKQFNFSPAQTLTLCQSLYEKHKCLSYPRTPSRVLGSSNVDTITTIIDKLSAQYTTLFNGIDRELIKKENTHVFNDAKLEDHHALIPLAPLPHGVSEDEKKIYMTVLSSLAAVFHPNHVYDETKVGLSVGSSVAFRCSGKAIIKNGWKDVFTDTTQDEEEKEDTLALPELKNGETIEFSGYEVLEKWTTAPKQFTYASLLSAMEKPSKFSTREYKFKDFGLGTPATRSAVIDVLLKREYITLRKKNVIPTDKGMFFYTTLQKYDTVATFTHVDETARWESLLRENPSSFFQEVSTFVEKAMLHLKEETFTTFYREKPVIGKCPLCNSAVHENKAAYYCSSWKTSGCQFKIWKSFLKAKISAKQASKLLSGEVSTALTFTKKDGSQFKAKLKLDPEQNNYLALTR